jgi:hypothetical protein
MAMRPVKFMGSNAMGSTAQYIRSEVLYTGLVEKSLIVSGLFSVLFLVSCARQDSATAPAAADLPHATVVMRDGARLTGYVAASSPSQITLNLDGGAPRTVAMKDVRRVDYGAATTAATTPASEPEPTHEDHHHAEQAAIQSRTFILPVGTELPVRTEETIDSTKAVEGQIFAAEVAGNVKDADGAVVIPLGANATMVIKSASQGGKFRGASDLVLDMRTVSVEGQQYALSTTDLATKGRDGVGVNKRTGEFGGGGAAVGAIIGAIAGGGKGAGIGAGAGGGAGLLTQILTKGGSIKVPAETVLTFKLDQTLKVVEAR